MNFFELNIRFVLERNEDPTDRPRSDVHVKVRLKRANQNAISGGKMMNIGIKTNSPFSFHGHNPNVAMMYVHPFGPRMIIEMIRLIPTED